MSYRASPKVSKMHPKFRTVDNCGLLSQRDLDIKFKYMTIISPFLVFLDFSLSYDSFKQLQFFQGIIIFLLIERS